MRALIVCDLQNDFCEGGALAVAGGTGVANAIREYIGAAGVSAHRYGQIVATRDWHIDPGAHFSAEPDYVSSWPPHCIAGSEGAQLRPELDLDTIDAVFDKGAHSAGYSGFEGVDARGVSLGEWLRRRGVDSVDVVGIATDHCVRRTAEDALAAGFATAVLSNLTAGVAAATTDEALRALRAAGITVREAP